MKLKRGVEVGMVLQEGGEDVVGEMTTVGPLFDNV